MTVLTGWGLVVSLCFLFFFGPLGLGLIACFLLATPLLQQKKVTWSWLVVVFTNASNRMNMFYFLFCFEKNKEQFNSVVPLYQLKSRIGKYLCCCCWCIKVFCSVKQQQFTKNKHKLTTFPLLLSDKDGKAFHPTYEEKLRLVALHKQVLLGPYNPDASPEVGFFDVLGNDRR